MQTILEFLLIIVCLAVAFLPWISAATRGRWFAILAPRISTAVLAAWVFLPALVILCGLAFHDQTPAIADLPANRPIQVKKAGYVGSDACRACHTDQHGTWHDSFHRTMTQVASPESIVGDFDDVLLHLGDEQFFFFRRGDQFFVEMDMPSWREYAEANPQAGQQQAPRFKAEVVLVTGRHHMQVYWYSTGQGRMLAPVPFVYLVDQKRWIPEDSSFLRESSAHPRPDFGKWNLVCSQCHTTHPVPGIDPETNMDSQVADFGIACEACHGPGSNHIHRQSSPLRRYLSRLGATSDPSIVNPAKLDHRLGSQVCGNCHGITMLRPDVNWYTEGLRFRPGASLETERLLVTNDLPEEKKQEIMHPPGSAEVDPAQAHYFEDRFWSDGMVRVSGREYNGLHKTPCFERGELSCLSCHTMHRESNDDRPLDQWKDDQLRIGMRSNQACVQCHKQFEDEEQLTAHSHHSVQSSGSLCYNCHMPHTTYGLLKAIRSHQIDVPSVQASVKTGRPNACNQCHLDKTLQWTADYLQRWYETELPVLDTDQQSVSAAVLWSLRGDAGQRALMAWSFGWEEAKAVSGSDWMVPFLNQLLDDPYDSVRIIAERSLRRLPPYADFKYDFTAPAKDRQAVQSQVLAIWRKNSRPRRADALLLTEEGLIDRERFDQLLKQRNDRRVYLKE